MVVIHRELLTPKAVARLLSMSTSTLARWRSTGEGPAFQKVGKRVVRYARADVEAWLTSADRGGSYPATPAQA